MSEVTDLLVVTAHDVFTRTGEDLELAIQQSGLSAIGEQCELADIAAVIRVSAYHGADGTFAERVMPRLDSERQRGALMRSIQMAGALERVLELTVGYARERIQFGRPIIQFQAVQQQLADLAGDVELARAAVELAIKHASLSNVAVAKVVAGGAAGRAAAISHQIHGAIGFTQEHGLHRFTTLLWRWRDEYGTEAMWADELGQLVARHGGEGAWELVSVD